MSSAHFYCDSLVSQLKKCLSFENIFQWSEMRPYGLRQSIRCPKKYGETITKRKYMLAPSYDAETDCEQNGVDSQRPLQDRYIRNAAILPDLRSDGVQPVKERTFARCVLTAQSQPLMIHGFSTPEYRQTYHAVVDPLLLSAGGRPVTYSLELGRLIKEHLFEELAYPTLQILEESSGKVEVTERFCVLRPAPLIDVDSRGEPM